MEQNGNLHLNTLIVQFDEDLTKILQSKVFDLFKTFCLNQFSRLTRDGAVGVNEQAGLKCSCKCVRLYDS